MLSQVTEMHRYQFRKSIPGESGIQTEKTALGGGLFCLFAHIPYGGIMIRMRTDLKKQLQNRLNRIQGQVAGLSRLVENDTYCIDIITQAQAIKSALSAVESLMLKNHLETHVVEQMRGKNQQKAVEEILKVYKVSQKK